MIGFGDFTIYERVMSQLMQLHPVLQLGIAILVGVILLAALGGGSASRGRSNTGGKYRSSDLKVERDGDHVTIRDARTGAILFDGSKEAEKDWRRQNMAPPTSARKPH